MFSQVFRLSSLLFIWFSLSLPKPNWLRRNCLLWGIEKCLWYLLKIFRFFEISSFSFDSDFDGIVQTKIFFTLTRKKSSHFIYKYLSTNLSPSLSPCHPPSSLSLVLSLILSLPLPSLSQGPPISLLFHFKSHQNWSRLNNFICGSVVRTMTDSDLIENKIQQEFWCPCLLRLWRLNPWSIARLFKLTLDWLEPIKNCNYLAWAVHTGFCFHTVGTWAFTRIILAAAQSNLTYTIMWAYFWAQTRVWEQSRSTTSQWSKLD